MAKKSNRRKDSQAVLFPEVSLPAASEEGKYDPLPSVWFGSDAELLDKMLIFYPRRRPERILDATINAGRFWEGLAWNVTGMDIDPKYEPDVVGDNRAMPFQDCEFEVVIYDPPHIPNQGRDHIKDFNTRFGLGEKSPAENGYNFTHLYPVWSKNSAEHDVQWLQGVAAGRRP